MMRVHVRIAAVLLSLEVVMMACGGGGGGGTTSVETGPSPTPSPTPAPYVLSVNSIPVEGARVVINPQMNGGNPVPGTGRFMGDTPLHVTMQRSDFLVNSNCPSLKIDVSKAGYYGAILYEGGTCLPTDNTGAPIGHLWEWTATLLPCPANVGPPYCGVVV
jgi:hypothetical protein